MTQLAMIHTKLTKPVIQVFHNKKKVAEQKFGRMLDATEVESMRYDPVEFLRPLLEAAEVPEVSNSIGLKEEAEAAEGIIRDH